MSERTVAASCSLARSTVGKYVQRAGEAGLAWPLPTELTDAALEQLQFQTPEPLDAGPRFVPDWGEVHRQLSRKGVTLQLVWEEYKEAHPDGFQYTQFCVRYRAWREVLDLPMRQELKAGERMFVDYCGQTMPVTDPKTGEVRLAQIFVAVLGASNYTYAEACRTQSLPEWVMAHVRAFLEARRQIGWLLRAEAAIRTVQSLFEVDKVAHGDTVNNVVCAADPEQVQEVVCAMAETLLRKKVFAGQRLLGAYYCVAVDGTGTYTFDKRHCEYCLTRTQNGKTTHYHNVLEAKLVTPDGFAISLMSEFIVNPGPNPTKQDCELKAFYRLASRLKERFPKLPVVLLLDALYACGPVFDLCRRNRWKFIINLKDGSLPSVNEEFHALWKRNPGCQLRFSTGPKGEVRQHLRWVNDIDYIDNDKRQHRLAVFECRETKPGKHGEDNTTTFRWVTNFTVKESNVEPLANQGGRLRWKIENEGFNTQKTGGYELEHTYTSNEQGMKNYYLLLQIACTIIQLIEKGSLLKKAFPKGLGSAKNLARLLLEAWRNQPVSPEDYRTLCDARIQIRFDSS